MDEKALRIKKLVIGLDFGTAFTKVVIGDNRVRYAVPFSDFAQVENHYLLPSVLNIENDNVCTLLTTAQSAKINSSNNLKFSLLDGSYTNDDLVRIAAFLALVFRETRSWLLERYNKRYARYSLSWSVNAGLPIDISDSTGLSDTYKQVIHTAWVISVLPGTVTLNRVRQYLQVKDSAFDVFPAIYRSKIISEASIFIFPACCAQICGFAHSASHEGCSENSSVDSNDENIYMMMDFGAGTVNIASFMVNENDAAPSSKNTGKQTFVLLVCSVASIGVSYFLKRRYENLQLPDDEIDLFNNIPDTHTFSQAHALTDKDIKFADTLYSGDVGKLINTILDTTLSTKNLDTTKLDTTIDLNKAASDSWKSGVPAFIYGGGAHLEIIQNIIDSHENATPPHKIKLICLDMPDDLMVENLPEGTFDRLSLAYGLSFDNEEIASIGMGETMTEINNIESVS